MDEKNPNKEDIDPDEALPGGSSGGPHRNNRRRNRRRNFSRMQLANCSSNSNFNSNSNSHECVVINLEGSHTTSTETENIPPKPAKHVSFENVVVVRECYTPRKCRTEETIKGVPLDTARASTEENVKACIDESFNVPRYITEDVIKACVDGTREQPQLPEEHVRACIDRAQSPPALPEEHVKACIDVAENVPVLPEDNVKACIDRAQSPPALPEENVKACVDVAENVAVLSEDNVRACIVGTKNEPVLVEDNVKACIIGTENMAVLPQDNVKACIFGTKNERILPEDNVKACIDKTENVAVVPEDNVKICIIGRRNQAVLPEDNVKACIDRIENVAMLPKRNINAIITETNNEPAQPENNIKAGVDVTEKVAILPEDNVKVVIDETTVEPVMLENNTGACTDETKNVALLSVGNASIEIPIVATTNEDMLSFGYIETCVDHKENLGVLSVDNLKISILGTDTEPVLPEDKAMACVEDEMENVAYLSEDNASIKAPIIATNNEDVLPFDNVKALSTENVSMPPEDSVKEGILDTKKDTVLAQDNVKASVDAANTVTPLPQDDTEACIVDATEEPVNLEKNSKPGLESASSSSSLKIKTFSFHFHEYKTNDSNNTPTENVKSVSDNKQVKLKKFEKRKFPDESENLATKAKQRPDSLATYKEDCEEKVSVQKLEALQQQSKVLPREEEISERFKNIMIMFDSFTKNLGSLEVQTFRDRAEVNEFRRETSKSRERVDVSPGVHRSRFENYMNEKRERRNTIGFRGSQQALHRSPTPRPSSTRSQWKHSSVKPKYKDAGTSMSAHQVTASVQTQVLQPLENAGLVNELKPHQRLHSSPASISADLSTSQSELRSDTNSFKVQNYHMDSASLVATTSKTICNSQHYGTDRLLKVSKSPSVIELVPCGATGERLYHTIQIDTTSSPTSSVMRRQPVWRRLWDVIANFCAAVCLCLQVNKDCIFCIGFFITFVVSASFLTAFFYRTLSVNSAIIQREAVPLEVELSQNPKDGKIYY